MSKLNKLYAAAILLLFTVLVVLHHFVPRPVDWKLSFSGTRKLPYGSRILADMLPGLFPGRAITVNTTSLYNLFSTDTLDSQNLIIVCGSFDPDEPDMNSLLDFISKGNYAFISALDFSGEFSDTLRFSTIAPVIDTSMFRDVKESLSLIQQPGSDDSLYLFSRRMPAGCFDAYDSLVSVPLGRDRKDNVNFIMVPFGRGKIYLHCQPLAFTNYHLLYGNYRYACTALSMLPVANTIWDQYYKPDKVLNMSPLRYILSQPALRGGYRVLLIIIIIYMVFGSKRIQRPIPVILPPQNSSMDFVKTVASLYFRNRNHGDIARKKLIYFNEFIRTRYRLPQTASAGDRIRSLSVRSGVEEGKVRHLLMIGESLEHKKEIGDYELAELHQLLEFFYRNCK